MSDHSTHHFTLNNSEKEQIKNALREIPYDPKGTQKYIKALRWAAYNHFPERLISQLENLKKNESSYCCFMNSPIDNIYGSPTNEVETSRFKDGHLSENLILSFGSVIAEPYSIHSEGKRIVNDITPHPTTTKHYTGLGSEVELDFHIENAAQVYDPRGDTSPLGLLLLGLRHDPCTKGPKTYVADARVALKKMSSEEKDILYGKHFIIRQPYRWRVRNNKDRETLLHPIITGPEDQPRVAVAFYPEMVLPVNEEAKSAYESFYKHICEASIGITIQPGCLLFINNRFTLHSREKFKPTFDNNGAPYRWVQRIFITNSLWPFRSCVRLGDRIFDPCITSKNN